jgi:hypothetical protein
LKVARLLIMGTLLVLSASAGIITGGGYQADDAIPFVFQFIATGGNPVGTRALNGTDDGTISVPIGFNFQFFGQTYSSICLSTNGLATFGGCDNSADSVDFATSGPPNNLPSIAPQWDDWQFLNPTTDAAYYLTQGAPGSRQFLVQWNLAQHLSAPDNADETTFQLALFEGSNGILFSYLDVVSVGIGSFGGLSQVGIRDTD